jgi:hypothetical protein
MPAGSLRVRPVMSGACRRRASHPSRAPEPSMSTHRTDDTRGGFPCSPCNPWTGKAIGYSGRLGKLVIVSFRATFCASCRKLPPWLRACARTLRPGSVRNAGQPWHIRCPRHGASHGWTPGRPCRPAEGSPGTTARLDTSMIGMWTARRTGAGFNRRRPRVDADGRRTQGYQSDRRRFHERSGASAA